MIKLVESKITGLYEIIPNKHIDERGTFIKIFHKNTFLEKGLITEFAEEYYTISYKGVLRGLHFQIPPQDHIKMVNCVVGEVIDVVVDLRVGSPTYGKYEIFNLNENKGNIVYIPSGMAHGFYVVSKEAILLYKVSTIYSPLHDAGIRWDSVGIPWPDNNPILSERDRNFLNFDEYKSPFIYKNEKEVLL